MRHTVGMALAAVAIVMMPLGVAGAKPRHREVPANVAIQDLLEHPDQYDGQRVVVTGFIRSIAFERGRRGSEYAVITLEEIAMSIPRTSYAVKVISLTMPSVGRCQHALVQGVYHREGNQAGRPYEFFIDAEAVLNHDERDSGLVPGECEEKL